MRVHVIVGALCLLRQMRFSCYCYSAKLKGMHRLGLWILSSFFTISIRTGALWGIIMWGSIHCMLYNSTKSRKNYEFMSFYFAIKFLCFACKQCACIRLLWTIYDVGGHLLVFCRRHVTSEFKALLGSLIAHTSAPILLITHSKFLRIEENGPENWTVSGCRIQFLWVKR